MTPMLVDRRLTRRLQRTVRDAFRRDPALRGERRRLARPSRRLFNEWMLRPLISALLFAASSGALHNIPGTQALVVIALCLTAIRAGCIQAALGNLPTLIACSHLPVAPSAVFHHQLRPELAKLGWFALDCLAFGLGACLVGASAWWQWAALPLWTVAHVLTMATLAVWAVVALPRAPFRLLQVAVVVVTVPLLMLALSGHVDLQMALTVLGSVTPTGWLQAAFAWMLRGEPFMVGLPLAAIIAGSVLLPAGVRRLERGFTLPAVFDLPQPVTAPAVAKTGQPVIPATTAAAPTATATDDQMTAVCDRWRAQSALTAGHTLDRHGWIGRAASGLLTPRLRTVADLLVYDGFHCGRNWCLALGCVLAGHLLVAIGLGPPLITNVLLGVAALFALPIIGSGWQGLFRGEATSGGVAPLAFLPIHLGQVVRVVLTLNALRMVAALPLIALALPVILPWPMLSTALPWSMAGKVAWLAWAAQPFLLATRLAGLGDAAPALRLANLPAVLAYTAIVLGFLPLIGGLFMGDAPVAIGCGLGLITLTSALLAATCLGHRRGTLDLISRPTS